MSKFGVSYLLDCYGCKPGSCDDLEGHYRLLEEMVALLKMDKMSAPIVIHAPAKFIECDLRYGKHIKVEEYPDKAGVSGWVPLIQSGIQIHSLEPTNFTSIDVYTCGQLNPEIVKECMKKMFDYKECEEYLIDRGIKYAEGS